MLGPSLFKTFGNYQKTDELDKISIILTVLIGFGSLLGLAVACTALIGIRKENLQLIRFYSAGRLIIFFILNVIYAFKYETDGQKELRPLWAHYGYLAYVWVYWLGTLPIIILSARLRKKKGMPLRMTMFGIHLRTLLHVQVIISWFGILYCGLVFWAHITNLKLQPQLLQPTPAAGFLIGQGLAFLCIPINSIQLLQGLKTNDRKKIKMYFYFKVIIFATFTITWYIFVRIRNEILQAPSPKWSCIYESVVSMIFLLESVELAHYMDILKLQNRLRYTKDDALEFEVKTSGIGRFNFEDTMHEQISVESVLMSVPSVPLLYKIKIGNILGQGEFSQVRKGMRLQGHIFRKTFIPVAVKLIVHKGEDGIFNTIVSEIKTLLRVKNHKNLVDFLGVCEYKEMGLGLVMEFCELGTLKQNLLKIKKSVDPMQRHDCLLKLNKWSIEIATAMEYLGQMKVIHGDLASRNVLLDFNETAKVSDFGMSFRLYNYQMYARSNQSVFPWRWMAPECLSDLKFSQKSDVWAYAVTLWEIYSLGEIPWKELTWTSDFISRLRQGLCLNKPELASNDFYNIIMRRCWHVEEILRLDFKDILSLFNGNKNFISNDT